MNPKKLVLIVALCLILPSLLYAQDEVLADVWTPELSMEYNYIPQTAISPDGQMVAYMVREPLMEGEESKYLSHIWISPTDGSESVQYTRGDHSTMNPSFSPDGQWLAFVSDRSGKNQIWMMRVFGGEAFQVSDGENGISNYRWSPDGQSFAYTMRDIDSEEEKKAKKEKRDVILVDQNYKYNHLYTIPVYEGEGGSREPVRLTEGNFTVSSFDWSPNGNEIVFAHQADPRLNTRFLESDISKVWVSDHSVTPLVDWEGVDATPFYSPDGNWIAFSSDGGQSEPVGLSDVFVIPSSGGKPSSLAHTHDRNVNLLGWAKDGTGVYFSEPMGTTRELLKLPLEGDPEVLFPAEGVKSAFSMSADGSAFAFSFEDSSNPVDVYVATIGQTGMKQLTDLHDDVPKPAMGKLKSLPGCLRMEWLLKVCLPIQSTMRQEISIHWC